jgi:hypothetical protein
MESTLDSRAPVEPVAIVERAGFHEPACSRNVDAWDMRRTTPFLFEFREDGVIYRQKRSRFIPRPSVVNCLQTPLVLMNAEVVEYCALGGSWIICMLSGNLLFTF